MKEKKVTTRERQSEKQIHKERKKIIYIEKLKPREKVKARDN